MCYSGVRYIGYVALSLASFIPVSCKNNTALLREDIAENYRYFSFEDTDDNGKFDVVVISDAPNSTGEGIRERIVGESIVHDLYTVLSKKRYKKITGQDYQEQGLEGMVQEQASASTEKMSPTTRSVEN